MDAILNGGAMNGTLDAIPSKSQLHRLLICAALGREKREIPCRRLSRDGEATVRCLQALGADIRQEKERLCIRPILSPASTAILPCGESGSTLRFLLPLAGALGVAAEFRTEGRLAERPLDPLLDALRSGGVDVHREGASFFSSGRLSAGSFTLPGNVSSQFISGMLLALPLLDGESRIILTSEPESAPYLEMTLGILREAGVTVEQMPDGYRVPGGQRFLLPADLQAEGDWSDAAVFLAAGALSGKVGMAGLKRGSPQGDGIIAEYLEQMGANVTWDGDTITAEKAALHPFAVNLRQTPDLAPVLAVLAAAAKGSSFLHGCARLRGKESDRLEALRQLICSLGGSAEIWESSLLVHGSGKLTGGNVTCFGDHRIVMAAALCSLIATGPVTIDAPECADKSHPGFLDDWNRLKREDAT